MRVNVFILVIACGAMAGCTDLTMKSRSYPFLVTKPVTVSPEGAILTAEVLDVGTAPVIRYGFMLNDAEVFELVNAIEFDKPFAVGTYSFTISAGLEDGKMYYMKPFAQTADNVVFGEMIQFESQGSLPTKILSFSPLEGPIGTQVVIQMENLGFPGLLGTRAEIYFGNARAAVDSVSDDLVYLKVPLVKEGGKVSLTIKLAGMQDVSAAQFDIWFPWTRLADFPGTYLRGVSSFVANETLYVLGGLRTNPQQVMNEFWAYDPATNQWTQKPPFPGTARFNAVSFSCNNRGYFGLGNTTTQYLNDLWEYDPLTSTWTQKADFPAVIANATSSFEIQDKGYVGLRSPVEIWEYSPFSNQWTQLLDAPTSVILDQISSASATKGFLSMGNYNRYFEFDPVSNTFTQVASVPYVSREIRGCMVDDVAYAGFGIGAGGLPVDDFWKYDVSRQSWHAMVPCPRALRPFVYEAIGKKAYFGYSYVQEFQSQEPGRVFYSFDPSRN